eukprot:5071128-Alexandrium_andersonii.AAC.1
MASASDYGRRLVQNLHATTSRFLHLRSGDPLRMGGFWRSRSHGPQPSSTHEYADNSRCSPETP